VNTLALFGNIIWFVFGGLIMGLEWWLAGILCFISIVGIPWGKACFVILQFTFGHLERKQQAESISLARMILAEVRLA